MSRSLWIVNPNTSVPMTEAVLQHVRALVAPEVRVHGWTAPSGPAVIDSSATFAEAASHLPGWAGAALPPPSAGQRAAIVLACFGDPGLAALQTQQAPRPVVGLAQAAAATVRESSLRFAIVTAGAEWVDMLQARMADFGVADRLTGVFALPFNGARYAQDPSRHQSLLNQAVRAAEASGAQALVLGGAAFAGLGARVETRLYRIDPLASAVHAALAALDQQGAAVGLPAVGVPTVVLPTGLPPTTQR